MAAITICSDFGAQKVSQCFLCFPIYLPWSDGTGCHDLLFWMLRLKPTFSLSSFTFTNRLFSSSLSALRVVSSAYLRLLIFLLAILIWTYASSSPAFHMMYSAYKLNKQGDNIQPWRTPFPIWNQSVVPCPVLLLLDLHTDFSGWEINPWSCIWACGSSTPSLAWFKASSLYHVQYGLYIIEWDGVICTLLLLQQAIFLLMHDDLCLTPE